jgi:hypothetical protein
MYDLDATGRIRLTRNSWHSGATIVLSGDSDEPKGAKATLWRVESEASRRKKTEQLAKKQRTDTALNPSHTRSHSIVG